MKIKPHKNPQRETLEEYLCRTRLECMQAQIELYDGVFLVREISTQCTIGAGATKEKALDDASLTLEQRDLFADEPSVPFSDLDKECRMSLKSWLANVKGGGLVDYDGIGHPATATHRGRSTLSPSYADAGKPIPKWVTHVCWYNK
jgi:hypothetical protein